MEQKEELHVVLFSSGASSAIVAERVLQQRAATLLFTDTQFEDEDNYRFLDEVLGYFKRSQYQFDFEHIKEGRNPLQVFEGEKILGSNRTPCCSKILKGQQTLKWLKGKEHKIILYFGFDFKELHRADRVVERYAEHGIECRFPLTEKPYLTISSHEYIRENWGIEPPKMYALGFSHANCGGRCVRGALQHWRHLLRVFPERFEQMAAFERKFKNGKYTYLKEMSLDELRRQYEKQLSLFEEDDAAQNVPCIQCI